MGAHDDEVGTHALDGAHDAVVHRMALAHYGVHRGHAGLRDGGLGGIQGGVGLGGRRAQVLRLAIGEIGAHAGERIGVDHVQRGDRAAEGLGQRRGLGHGLHGGFRTVHGNQDVLEHGISFAS
jgi:hypothetical protein